MRVGKIWQRKQTGSYYCTVNGKQTLLGKTFNAAQKAHRQLLKEAGFQPQRLGERHKTLTEVLTAYLVFTEHKNGEATYKNRLSVFNNLMAEYGNTAAKDFTGADLLDFVSETYGDCGNTRKHDVISWTQTALKWVEGTYQIPSGIKNTPKPTPDQREFFLPHDRWDEVLKACNNTQIKAIVKFMLFTGARPQEARHLQLRHWQPQHNRFVLPREEAKGKRHPRYIAIPSTILEAVKTRIANLTNQNDHVFTNTKGNAWTKAALNSSARRIKVAIGEKEFCMYVCRHSFATDQLLRCKLSYEEVAKLMGHTSTAMVYQKYGHVLDDPTYLSGLLDRAPAAPAPAAPVETPQADPIGSTGGLTFVSTTTFNI